LIVCRRNDGNEGLHDVERKMNPVNWRRARRRIGFATAGV
jgi:hypothetical protein